MIVTEKLTVNGKSFTKTYSDSGFMVERDGARYSEAIDPAELNREYAETDESVDDEIADSEALAIIVGGASDA